MDIGDRAPDFELPDETGTMRTLRGFLADGPVVLFFYPGAMTPGCTLESCHFRDMAAEYKAVGAGRVGISADPVAKQKRFSDRHRFDYPLLSDDDGAVARLYGARRDSALAPTRRITFVIGSDGVVLAVLRSELRFWMHASRALEILRQQAASSAPG